MVRPSSYARGYDQSHREERARWAPKVDAGQVDCARCGERLEPGRPWDLGHNDERTAWTGPEHTICNRRAAGQIGRAMQLTRSCHTSRTW